MNLWMLLRDFVIFGGKTDVKTTSLPQTMDQHNEHWNEWSLKVKMLVHLGQIEKACKQN